MMALLDPTPWLESLQALNPETSTTMLAAELLWFCGGMFSAFVLCSACTIIRALKGAGGSVDL